MKYFKQDDCRFIAIDKSKDILYEVSITPNSTVVQLWENPFMIEVIEERKNNVKISANEFQEKFSKAVEIVHNQTPFA